MVYYFAFKILRSTKWSIRWSSVYGLNFIFIAVLHFFSFTFINYPLLICFQKHGNNKILIAFIQFTWIQPKATLYHYETIYAQLDKLSFMFKI